MNVKLYFCFIENDNSSINEHVSIKYLCKIFGQRKSKRAEPYPPIIPGAAASYTYILFCGLPEGSVHNFLQATWDSVHNFLRATWG